MEWCLNGFKNIFVFRAEEVFETTDEGQQYTAEVAGYVWNGGRPEEIIRAAVTGHDD